MKSKCFLISAHYNYMLPHIRMLEITLNLDFDKLKKLFNQQTKEYIWEKWRSTLKSATFAILFLAVSVMMFVFSGTKYHFVPWNIVSGFVGLYFIFKAIVNQSKGYMAIKKANAETASFVANLEQIKSVTYKVTGHAIEYFIDNKLESTIEWSKLSSIIEKEGYFYMFFENPKKHILIPEFAVTTEFYNGILVLAKRKYEVNNM